METGLSSRFRAAARPADYVAHYAMFV